MALLAVATLAAYWSVGTCDFVPLDDFTYVKEQPMVSYGLRPAAIEWAFTAPHAANWHPLTSLSHMLDCSLFGLAPAPHHWENLGWHVLNALLVFLAWRALTGAVWPSAIVAALFALHPLHVESVAWVSERKDVLSTFFWLLGLCAWARYVRRSARIHYALALLCCALGLLSKPMVVTLPFTLLLLDWWPLQRLSARSAARLVWEKAPFFVLAGISGVMTQWFQHAAGAGDYGAQFSFFSRLGNALASYARYLGKTLWPETLAVLYPHPGSWPWWALLGALGLLGALTWLALRTARRRPWAPFGWFWFLGTLVPVIGLMQVGTQAMADRYTYVPLLGIFTLLAWSGAELIQRFPTSRVPVAVTAVLLLGGCLLVTRQQVQVWQNGVRLVEHCIAVTPDNPYVRLHMASALDRAGRPEAEVMAQFQRAVQLDPTNFPARSRLAESAAKGQRFDEARSLLDGVRCSPPWTAELASNRGLLAVLEKKPEEATAHFLEAVRIYPDHGTARRELAAIHYGRSQFAEAQVQLEAAIKADRWDFLAHERLGIVLVAAWKIEEGRAALERAVWINPGCQLAPARLQQLRNRKP